MKKRFIKAISLVLLLSIAVGIMSGCRTPAGVPSITVDTESVPATSQEVRLTFNVSNATFDTKSFDADKVVLSGAFDGMTVKVEKVEKGSVRLLLSGTVKRNEVYNAYDCGTVEFISGAFSDSQLSLGLSLDIDIPTLDIDNGSPKLANGVLTIGVKTSGYVLASDISADDILIDGVKVASASVKDNGTIEFSVKTGALTVDAALDELSGKTITVKSNAVGTDEDISLTAYFPTATFYYSGMSLERDGESRARMDLELTAINGTFDAGVGATAVSLYGDLAESKLESVLVGADRSTATVSVLLSDAAAEKLYNDNRIDVLVELYRGALVNEWGTSASESSYFYQTVYDTPDYDHSKADDNYKNVRDFCDYVGSSSITKALGPIGSLVSLATGAVVTAYDLSKLCGFVEEGDSEFDIICSKFDEISASLAPQDAKLDEVLKQLEKMQLNDVRKVVHSFTVQMTALDSYTNSVASYINIAAKELMTDAKAPEKSLSEISEKVINARTATTTDEQLYGMLSKEEKALLNEWTEYYDTLFERLETEASKSSRRNNKYSGYNKAVETLQQQFTTVCVELNPKSSTNVFDSYDQLCAGTYLFDVTALPDRELYRSSARATLDCAMTMLLQIYGLYDNSPVLDLYENYYIPAVTTIINNPTKRTVAPELQDKVYFYASDKESMINFSTVWYDYDTEAAAASEENRREIEKKVKEYYEYIRQRLFWSNLSDDAMREVKIKLKGMGYTYTNYESEMMVYEARTMAQVFDYPLYMEQEQWPCFYLASFESIEIKWNVEYGHPEEMTVILKNCVLYDMITGNIVVINEIENNNPYSSPSGKRLYALYFNSTSNKQH